MEMAELEDFLNNSVYPSLDRLALFSGLNPLTQGNYIVLDCPGCHRKHHAFVKQNGKLIRCNDGQGCAYKQIIWDYLCLDLHMKKKEALQLLAKLAACRVSPALIKMSDSLQAETLNLEMDTLVPIRFHAKKSLVNSLRMFLEESRDLEKKEHEFDALMERLILEFLATNHPLSEPPDPQ